MPSDIKAAGALDRLDACAKAGWVAIAFVLAVFLTVGAHLVFHQRAATPARAVMARAAGTLTPAFMPAGSLFRSPELQHRSVDLRYSPGMPLARVSPAGLLFDSGPWVGHGGRHP
ncbi:MAG: hypothetical protein JEZ11_11265 [Desulfobacterales bacterium]|nr:hypothetical protein [Desulfobacterales bacterium]